MAVVESQVTATELERVIPKIRDLFESDDFFYANIKKRDVEVISNRQMRIPLGLRPGGAFQYFNPDGGDLGRGGGPTWDKAVVTAVFVSENIEYTKLTQWATDNDRKAITNAVRRMTAGALDEMRRQLDSQLMQRGKGVITSWDVENKQIGVTPSIAGAVSTDVIVTDGITSPSSLPALYGVPYHHSNASTGTWLGFARSSTPEIRANRVNANSGTLTLPLPRLAINKIGNRIGLDNNFNPNAWMHPAQKQAYEEIGQLVTQIWKEPKEQSLNMYYDKMQMAGAPVKESFNWDKTRIDFVVDSVWGRAEILPIGFYLTDGRRIFEIRSASGGVAAADIFYMVNGFQTFVNNPAGCAYIDTLAVPSGY